MENTKTMFKKVIIFANDRQIMKVDALVYFLLDRNYRISFLATYEALYVHHS